MREQGMMRGEQVLVQMALRSPIVRADKQALFSTPTLFRFTARLQEPRERKGFRRCGSTGSAGQRRCLGC